MSTSTTGNGQFIFHFSPTSMSWLYLQYLPDASIFLHYDGNCMLQMQMLIKTKQQMVLISLLFAWENKRLQKIKKLRCSCVLDQGNQMQLNILKSINKLLLTVGLCQSAMLPSV